MSELIPGIAFDFGGGRIYTVPPLSLGALQRLQGNLGQIAGVAALSPDTIATVLQAAHAALKRNYPDLSEADVAELVDVGNMHDVMACVLDVTGLKRKALDDAKNQQAQPAPPTALTGPD